MGEGGAGAGGGVAAGAVEEEAVADPKAAGESEEWYEGDCMVGGAGAAKESWCPLPNTGRGAAFCGGKGPDTSGKVGAGRSPGPGRGGAARPPKSPAGLVYSGSKAGRGAGGAGPAIPKEGHPSPDPSPGPGPKGPPKGSGSRSPTVPKVAWSPSKPAPTLAAANLGSAMARAASGLVTISLAWFSRAAFAPAPPLGRYSTPGSG
mmetsp:Transcript_95170/g.208111  ORF Transcript_95170/g.208111 Transcript_95170/m.208111 type:complete len:205 (+) Transcript_95170:1262-1876(+)